MKTKILSGLICCLGIFSANAQTITAPVGQSLTVTNPIDITVAGGSVNVPTDGSFNIGGAKILSVKGSNLLNGEMTGNALTSGAENTFIGSLSGNSTTIGGGNVFLGVNSGRKNIGGSLNMFLGGYAGFENTTGLQNTYVGAYSGEKGIIGSYNAALGAYAGRFSVGTGNTFVGSFSGINLDGGNFNTFIGYDANISALSSLSNVTVIGANARASTSNTIVLGNNVTTITGTGLAAGSGLRFANITSASAAGTGGANKVLSVDAAGNVILVGLTGATTTSVGGPVAESTWKESDGYLYNNSTNGVVIKGTGLDGNSLIVKGGVLSKEVNVKVEGSESWPDYVFKPNYKRMTLGEVEKFISINGHLPNIPSATEMAATGNNLGKTDAKLLEKVEELTLYLLEMKKANDVQAAELKTLKQQVSKLRKK